MEITKISVEGFANVDSVELNLKKFNALVALNNHGKSNVISAIEFGVGFIKNQPSIKNNMMAFRPFIPINKNIDNKPFKFEIIFEEKVLKEDSTIVYGFSFDWIKNDNVKGQRIKDEYLKIKTNKADSKFKTFISRNLKETLYLPSQTGRCDKPLRIKKNELAINKLTNFDDLFYIEVVEMINEIAIANVDTLQNPNKLFRRINPDVLKTDYSLEMPDSADVGFFIYSLKAKKPQMFELFRDSVMSLLPGLEDLEPIEIDLKKEAKFKTEKQRIPLSFPEKLYDIRVKELNNNQQTNIDRLSSGSQKIIFILALVIATEINNVPLITFEELENSIHPGLLQKLLIIIDGLTENTKVILTSHSPYLIQYLDIERIKIGIPNQKGLAIFKEVRKSKFNRAINIAEDEGVSIGDLVFDKMIECSNGESELLNDLCF
jgi:predicted ATPase